MLKQLRQIWADHQAMNAIRSHFGDIHLVATIKNKSNGFTCNPFQSEIEIFDKDPAKATICAIKEHKKQNQ